MSEVAPRQFALFAYSGGFLWVATFLSLGYFLGERWKAVEGEIHRYAVLFTLAAAVALVGYLIWRWLLRRRQSSKQRR
jgi:membrane protein DedA with SNARE-associated domain